MARYAVTMTRVVTETAVMIVEADDPGQACLRCEEAPWTDATITTSHDNMCAEDGWSFQGDPQLIQEPRTVHRRRAAA